MFTATWTAERPPRHSTWLVLNEMSRFHLALDALKHAPRLRMQAEHAINFFNQECNATTTTSVKPEDMPEIRNWQWTEGL